MPVKEEGSPLTQRTEDTGCCKRRKKRRSRERLHWKTDKKNKVSSMHNVSLLDCQREIFQLVNDVPC